MEYGEWVWSFFTVCDVLLRKSFSKLKTEIKVSLKPKLVNSSKLWVPFGGSTLYNS